MQISAKRPGAANLMAYLCSELDIARCINNMVTWGDKQWKVSLGTLITSLVINTLVHRTPLFNVEDFYQGIDLPLLFAEDILAQDLNDNAPGSLFVGDEDPGDYGQRKSHHFERKKGFRIVPQLGFFWIC